jgi:hypothetical protein
MNRNLLLFFPLNFNRIMATENGKIINENKIKTYIGKKIPLLSGVDPGNCLFFFLTGGKFFLISNLFGDFSFFFFLV